MATSLAFIDDDAMLLEGLELWAAREGLAQVRTFATVADYLAAEPSEIVVLDVRLADDSAPVTNVRELVASGASVLLYSATPHPQTIADALRAGASGFVEKAGGFAALERAVSVVAGGGEYLSSEMAFAISRDKSPDRPQLTPREVAVLSAYASGLTMASVARRLGMSESTALTHLGRVKDKYRGTGRAARTKLELAQRWSEDRHSLE